MSEVEELLLQDTVKNKKEVVAFRAGLDFLKQRHPEIVGAIVHELELQRTRLKLIASENYCSLDVQLAMGNWLTDKYAEGYPEHRFYAGCENVDTIEKIAVEKACALFGADHAFVQPHSGADANLIAFWAILVQKVQNPYVEKLGKKNVLELTEEEYEEVRQLMVNQKMMGLSLSAGGHLTHGFRQNLSSKMMKSVFYDVNPVTEMIDYAALEEQVVKENPLILVAGYSAYPRKLDFKKFRAIADRVGAVLLVDMAHFAGLVAGGVFVDEFNPVPYADIITSTTHKTLRGPRGGLILCKEAFKDSINRACPLAMGGPAPHIMAAKAIAFEEASQTAFEVYSAQVVENAQALASALEAQGIRVVTNGTDNHLVVMDVSSLGITGKQAESALFDAGIITNRNQIPHDKMGAWYTSGIRLGTSALTTLGLGIQEMEKVAAWIGEVLHATKRGEHPVSKEPSLSTYLLDPHVAKKVKNEIIELLKKFPLYPQLKF